MPALAVTTLTAGVLGAIFLVLSTRVVMGRASGQVMLGSGETTPAGDPDPLFVAIRSQANFAEYVPLCLILIGLVELQSGPTILVKTLSAVLVLARIAHPIGMAMKPPNVFRAAGWVLTILVLLVASLAAIWRVV